MGKGTTKGYNCAPERAKPKQFADGNTGDMSESVIMLSKYASFKVMHSENGCKSHLSVAVSSNRGIKGC
jgi:hypothetical protein